MNLLQKTVVAVLICACCAVVLTSDRLQLGEEVTAQTEMPAQSDA